MVPRRSAAVVLLWLAVLAGPPARAADKTPADLVLVQQGALPIILTAPHGGREAIPGIEPRRDTANDEAYRKWGGFRRGADTNTDILAQGIAAEVAKLTGKKPYLVVARFSRTYVDANRPPELGLDSPEARPYYDTYHRSIRRFIDEIRRSYPAGLLIDVHGQSKDPDVLMRGTLNGRTVERLLRRAGVEAVTGPKGIYGQLEANGFKVFPGNDVPPAGRSEDAGFNGGYTVFIYGSHNPTGFDAVQMEFGTRYRQKAVLDKSARDAAKAIAAFHEAYLKQPASR
jgi:N-formylglutamate amidohydrolase